MAVKTKIKKVRWVNLISVLVICFLIGFGIFYVTNTKIGFSIGYLKGNTETIEIRNEQGEVIDKVARGSEIKYTKKDSITIENEIYLQAKTANKEFYVNENAIASEKTEVVTETEGYVRTTYHLLGENLDGTLLDYVDKGSKLDIIGYHDLQPDGAVDYYKVKLNNKEGYFPAQYLVATEEEAQENYDENVSYQVHLKRQNVYGGGSAASADYYPVEKPKFEDNPMPEEVRSLYLNGTKKVMQNVDKYIELAKKSNINAFVVDIKDSGVPAYQSEVMKMYSKTNYEHAQQSMEDYKNAIKKLKDAGYYVIGRISTFKDEYYAIDHPEHAILDTRTGKPYYLANSYWPSAYSRDVWKFNVDLAKEAVKEIGFNEIQFDYVRFPDRVISLEKQGLMDFRNNYGEEKIQAVQRFLMYATNELHQLHVYVSADVFGESAHTYVTAYGQYWPAISNVVDVISGMPYPDHFSTYEYGFKEPVWTKPYEILNYWGSNYVVKRQAEIPTPAIVRTWVQAYDTIKKPYVTYGTQEVSQQIQGLYDAGLNGGYITWNSSSNLEKYKSQLDAFSKEYKK